jgi:hypothetical protein
MKLKEIDALNLSKDDYKKEIDNILTKDCLCVGLGISTLKSLNIKPAFTGPTSICPGPNLAYFSNEINLEKMCKHIYGEISLLNDTPRPNMFIKELNMYQEILEDKKAALVEGDKKGEREIKKFVANLESGVNYYKDMGLL